MSFNASQGKHIGLDPVMGTNPLYALTPNIPAAVSPAHLQLGGGSHANGALFLLVAVSVGETIELVECIAGILKRYIGPGCVYGIGKAD